MKKIINKELSNYDVEKRFIDWIVKIQILKMQIEKLDKTSGFLISSIASFLLKSQIIEFELKQLLTALDLHFNNISRPHFLKRKIRTPKDFDRFTLGKIVGEINLFDWDKLDEMKDNLGFLVKKRNDFVHNLFGNDKNIKELEKEAKIGIIIANNVIRKIEELESFLKEEMSATFR